jgi:hypothetical protein
VEDAVDNEAALEASKKREQMALKIAAKKVRVPFVAKLNLRVLCAVIVRSNAIWEHFNIRNKLLLCFCCFTVAYPERGK